MSPIVGGVTGAAIIIALAIPTEAADIVGAAQVRDGDSLVVAGREIRLHGVDAPEWSQPCALPNGETWFPGKVAASRLRSMVTGHPISCSPTKDDRYGRVVATCFRGDLNLNEWLTREGWAFAYRRYSDRYVAVEAEARAAGRGLWRGICAQPEAWRRSRKAT